MKEVKDNESGVESHELHNDRFSARIYIMRKDETEEMNKLHQAEVALEKFGIRLSVGPSRYQDSKGFLACVLNVHIDSEITSRGAGRHTEVSGFTLEDVDHMLADGLSPQEIADKGQMSLATFYRRRKKALALKDAGHIAANIPF